MWCGPLGGGRGEEGRGEIKGEENREEGREVHDE